MKCPHCSHVSDSVLLKCRSCGETYHQQTLEEFQHVNYLLDWLEEQREVVGETMTHLLVKGVQAKRSEILSVLLPQPTDQPMPVQAKPLLNEQVSLYFAIRDRLPGLILSNKLSVPSAGRLRADLNAKIQAEHPEATDEIIAVLPEISSIRVNDEILRFLDVWIENGLIVKDEAGMLRDKYQSEADKPEIVARETVTKKGLLPNDLTAEQRNRLSVLNVARKNINEWVKKAGVSYLIGVTLNDVLRAEMKEIHPDAVKDDFQLALPQASESLAWRHTISQLGSWVARSLLSENNAKLLLDYDARESSTAIEQPVEGREIPAVVAAVAEPSPAAKNPIACRTAEANQAGAQGTAKAKSAAKTQGTAGALGQTLGQDCRSSRFRLASALAALSGRFPIRCFCGNRRD